MSITFNTHFRRRSSIFQLLLCLFAVLLSVTPSVFAYVTSAPGAVPLHRQREWLKKMTASICQVKPGQLSHNQLSQAPDLIYAWSHIPSFNDKGKENALAAESLVKRMIQEQRAGNAEAKGAFKLTVDDYNCLLEGWASSRHGVAAAERCEQILSAMEEQGPKPNRSSFKAALMAWRLASVSSSSSSVDHGDYICPHRMQRLLQWMIQLYEESGNVNLLPDADCFDNLLQTWSRSGHPQAPQKTEQVLGVMERLYEKTGDPKVKPRTTSFNAVLAAWSKCKSTTADAAANRVCNILSFMELLESQGDAAVAPDSASYNIVMLALAKTQDQAAAAQKADECLRRIEKRFYENYATPSVDDEDEDAASASASVGWIPESILYNTAIGCLAKSQEPDAFLRARSILDRQIALCKSSGYDKRCKPDVYGFTSVITSCASVTGGSRERRQAFDVALQTFQQLQQQQDEASGSGGPNHVSYGAMLKAYAKLLPARSTIRQKWAPRVFIAACEAGLVGDMVVSRLREAVTPDVYRELLQGHSKKSLPPEWTRNVPEGHDFKTKKQSSSKKKKRRTAEV